jgi:hypothetical protein
LQHNTTLANFGPLIGGKLLENQTLTVTNARAQNYLKMLHKALSKFSSSVGKKPTNRSNNCMSAEVKTYLVSKPAKNKEITKDSALEQRFAITTHSAKVTIQRTVIQTENS